MILVVPQPIQQRAEAPQLFVLVASTTAAVTTAISAALAAPSAAVAAAPSVLTRPGLVDGEVAAVHVFAVKCLDGGLRLLVASHLNEAEALGTARVPVHDDLSRLHCPMRLEQLPQITVVYAVGQIAHVQLFAQAGPPSEKKQDVRPLWGKNTMTRDERKPDGSG